MTRRAAPVSPPVVLSIAGSDSGGGAGIQADVKTIEACGGFGTSAITSVTAQNTRGVEGVHLLPIADIEAQIEAVTSDFDVAAVKTGMLATSEVVDLVADYAPDLPNLVVDPVMVAASGDRLLDRDAEDAYGDLIAHAALVTPNADEAGVLTDVAVEDEESAVRAGTILVEGFGASAALVKGGHVPGDVVGDVLVTDDGGTEATTITHERVDTDATHGSGCTLSSAIATELAHGADLTTAVTAGIELLASAVRYNLDVGEGPGAVHHLVALRNDAALGGTIDALEAARGRLEAGEYAPLASPAGDTLACTLPYAESPEHTATTRVALGGATDADGADATDPSAGGAGPDDPSAGDADAGDPNAGDADAGDSTSAGHLSVGGDDRLARAVLAAREHDPDLRFALACRFDEAVASALEALPWAATVTADAASVDDSAVTAGEETSDALARAVDRAFGAADESPFAIGLSDDGRESTAVLFGASIEELTNRARTLAATVDGGASRA